VCADATCASPLSDVIAVTANDRHTCALTSASGVKCWGSNWNGELGDGTGANPGRTTPVDVCADATCAAPISGVSAIVAGVDHACAMTSPGGLKCWGDNWSGQLGDGSEFDSSTTPVDVCADATCAEPLSGVSTIAAGGWHTCAVISAGGVKCWGENFDGQIGDGTTMSRRTPVDVCADATCETVLRQGVATTSVSASSPTPEPAPTPSGPPVPSATPAPSETAVVTTVANSGQPARSSVFVAYLTEARAERAYARR
jgi:alpha-tubulin suppressor-like RCC1 family protein